MKHRSHPVLPDRLAQGHRQFQQWRSHQKTRRRLPDHLWSLAVDLARQFGVGRTAKALRLDHTKLKAKCQNTPGRASDPLAFLELRPQRGPLECTVQCQRSADVQTIRLTLSGPDLPDLTELCQGLWRS
jgi:hypothetical protein